LIFCTLFTLFRLHCLIIIIIISLFIQQQNSTNTVTTLTQMKLKREWQGWIALTVTPVHRFNFIYIAKG